MSLGQEVLGRLVRTLGGPDAAAARLGISRTLLERFLKGAIAVPDAILLKAVDYALDDPASGPSLSASEPPPSPEGTPEP
jgi:hypothetical protein